MVIAHSYNGLYATIELVMLHQIVSLAIPYWCAKLTLNCTYLPSFGTFFTPDYYTGQKLRTQFSVELANLQILSSALSELSSCKILRLYLKILERYR